MKSLPVGLSIDGNFDSFKTISHLSDVLFRLEKVKKEILATIATKGPLNGNQLFRSVKKVNGDFTEDVVRYALYDKKNLRSLKRLNFVEKTTGQKVGSFKEQTRYEQIYSLTLKGLLASMSKVPFEDNYMIKKKYTEFIKAYYDIPYLSEFAIHGIKYDIALFLFDQYYKGIILTDSNIGTLIHEFHRTIPYGGKDLHLDLKEEDKKLFEQIINRYWLTANLLCNIRIQITEKYDFDIPMYNPIYEWFKYIETIQNYTNFSGNITKYKKEVVEATDFTDEDFIYENGRTILKNHGVNNYFKVSDFWE